MNCKCKPKDLSLSQKIEIIQLASEKVFQTELSQQFGCSQSMISKILVRKMSLSRTQQRTLWSGL